MVDARMRSIDHQFASSKEALAAFFGNGKLLQPRKNQVMYDAGALSRSVFYIESGYIKSYSITPEGEYNILSFYGPDSIFPLGPVLRENAASKPFDISGDAYFECMSNATIYEADSEQFIAFINTHPELYKELVHNVLRSYAVFSGRVGSQQFRYANQRVMYQLLMLGSRFGKSEDGGTLIDLPMTHQDLADSLGMARETVTRELERLRKKGWVENKNKHILIHDMEGMKSFLYD